MLTIYADGFRYQWAIGKAFQPEIVVGALCRGIPWGGSYVSLSADGEEAEYIRRHFQNIPTTDATRLTWSDMGTVQFITDNLAILSSRQQIRKRRVVRQTV